MFRLSNLKRIKSGAFKARKAIPAAVRAAYQRLYGQGWEAVFSLPAGTSPSVAKTQYTEWLALVERRIAALQSNGTNAPTQPALTMQQADAIAGEWYRQYVAAREAEPGDAIGWEDALSDAEDILLGRADLPDDVMADAERFIADRGLHLSPVSMEKFQIALAREYRAAAATLLGRSEGDRGRDVHLDRLAPVLEPVGSQPVALRPGPAKAQKSPRQAAAALLEAYAADRGVAPSTLLRWKPVMATLDTQPWQRPDWDAQEWIDSLVTEGRSKGTVQRTWLGACKTLMRWALKRKRIATNPFTDVVMSVPKKVITRETGRGFTDAEVKTILSAALQVPLLPIGSAGFERSASRRWLPWLMAYTGARAGEVAQLRAGDVDPARKTILITPEAGTVKTRKARVVPVHADLIEQGFLEFVRAVLAAKGPGGALFWDDNVPAKADAKCRRSDMAANKLAKWVRGLGITDPGISPNHAWRHTFKTRARRAGIDQGIRDAICGHSSRSVAQDYEHVSIDDMAEALKRFPRYTVTTPPHDGKR
jgi:integrase